MWSLWLVSFPQINVFKVHLCSSMCQSFLHFHGWITVCSTDRPKFICSPVDGHFVCFHFLAVINHATCVHVFAWMPVFNSPGYIPRSGISGSWDNSVFNVSGNHRTVFHSGCPISILTSNAREGSHFSTSVWFCFKSNSEDGWQQNQAIEMERIRKRYNERIKGFRAADSVMSLLDEEESGRNPMSSKIKYFKHYHYQPTLPAATCSFVLLSPSWAACIFIFRDLN